VDRDERQPEHLRGKLLQISWYDEYGATEIGPRKLIDAGGRWEFTLRLRAPRGLSNPGGFDSERTALAHRLAATGYVRQPETAYQRSNTKGIDAWRDRLSIRIRAATPATGRFICALAIGDTRGLSSNDWEILRATGLTHLVAISGFHVGMVASFFALSAKVIWWLCPGLARRWPRPQAMAAAASLSAVGYAALAGFALPTVRTVLMIGMVALARSRHRPSSVMQTLMLALVTILVFDPLSILLAGFWLSFAGVAWLVWCLPNTKEPLWRSFLSAQGVATIGLLPLTVMLFGQASFAGPWANLLAIPWWSLVVVPFSLIGTALDSLHAGWGEWAWKLAAYCFDPSWKLFEWIGTSRFALLWLPEPRDYALPLALLGAFWLLLPRGIPGKPLTILLWLPLFFPPRELPRHGEAELVLFDVGQGLSVLVRTAGHVLLYDAGPGIPEGFNAGERVVVPAMHALGVRRLDRIVISHADTDHSGGLNAVRQVFPTADMVAPAGAPLSADMPCLSGTTWEWDGVRFQILYPIWHFPYLRNESSCVLRIETRYGAALLTGDIGKSIERHLLGSESNTLRADVAIVPHHGSRNSLSTEFIGTIGARLALISAGHGNRFGHPHEIVVHRWQHSGAEVLNTAESGAVRVWLTAEGLSLREHRKFRSRIWDTTRQR
jgi:competence protein ComEC